VWILLVGNIPACRPTSLVEAPCLEICFSLRGTRALERFARAVCHNEPATMAEPGACASRMPLTGLPTTVNGRCLLHKAYFEALSNTSRIVFLVLLITTRNKVHKEKFSFFGGLSEHRKRSLFLVPCVFVPILGIVNSLSHWQLKIFIRSWLPLPRQLHSTWWAGRCGSGLRPRYGHRSRSVSVESVWV
jgi:hypothetical protein